jgi:hypothetical protein
VLSYSNLFQKYKVFKFSVSLLFQQKLLSKPEAVQPLPLRYGHCKLPEDVCSVI